MVGARKHTGAGLMATQVEEFVGFRKPVDAGITWRSCPRQDVGRDVEARTVRHRRAVNQAGVLVRRSRNRPGGTPSSPSDCGARHRALRPAGGTAGVEQPRQCDGSGVRGFGVVRFQALPNSLGRVEPMFSIGTWVNAIRAGGDLRRREHLRGTGVIEDLRHLQWVQHEVDWHHGPSGGPHREHQLDDLRPVLAGDRDARHRYRGRRSSEVASRSARSRSSAPRRAAVGARRYKRAALAETGRGLVEY